MEEDARRWERLEKLFAAAVDLPRRRQSSLSPACRAQTAARKMVVETGLHYYDTLVQEAHGDRDLLEEIARGYDRLGDAEGRSTTASLRDSRGALDSYQKARAIRQGISDSSLQFLSESIVGDVRIGQALTGKGGVKQAQSILGNAINHARSGPNAGAHQVRQALADA